MNGSTQCPGDEKSGRERDQGPNSRCLYFGEVNRLFIDIHILKLTGGTRDPSLQQEP